MYAKQPSDDELRLFGLTRADIETAVEVWPENWPAVQLFAALGTQWRIAHCGRTGLDYNALPVVMRLQQIPRAHWPDLFDAIRTMEDAALTEMHKDDTNGQ